MCFSPHSHDPNINRKETLPSKKASWNVAFPAQELLHKIYFSECPNGSLHYHQKYYRGTIVGINRSGHDNHSTTPLQISEDRETVALSNWQSPYISYVKLEHTPHVTMHFLCESGMRPVCGHASPFWKVRERWKGQITRSVAVTALNATVRRGNRTERHGPPR